MSRDCFLGQQQLSKRSFPCLPPFLNIQSQTVQLQREKKQPSPAQQGTPWWITDWSGDPPQRPLPQRHLRALSAPRFSFFSPSNLWRVVWMPVAAASTAPPLPYLTYLCMHTLPYRTVAASIATCIHRDLHSCVRCLLHSAAFLSVMNHTRFLAAFHHQPVNTPYPPSMAPFDCPVPSLLHLRMHLRRHLLGWVAPGEH